MTRIERAARAICAAKGANPDQWQAVEHLARAAVEACDLHARLVAEEQAPPVKPDHYSAEAGIPESDYEL